MYILVMESNSKKGFWCRTTFCDSVKTSFVWSIENFKNREEKFKEKISSSIFKVMGSDKRVSEWVIEVFPKGDEESFMNRVRIGLTSKNDFPVKASWSGYILGRNNKKKHKKDAGIYEFKRCGKGWGFSDYPFHSEFTDSLIPGGNLTLVFKITVYGEGKNVSGSIDLTDNNNYVKQARSQRQMQVCDHLGQVLADKEFADVDIVCDTAVFPCHQLILAARSPVFRAMFKAEMKEKLTRKIVIKDCHPDVVFEMLNFIYTGDISTEKLSEMARDLLCVGEMYQLDCLKNMCEDELCSTLDVEKSIEYLVLGDSNNATKLKKMALELLSKNMKNIVDTDVYKDLFRQKPDLAWEVNMVKMQEDA